MSSINRRGAKREERKKKKGKASVRAFVLTFTPISSASLAASGDTFTSKQLHTQKQSNVDSGQTGA
jgi:hypothetical protein